MLIYLMAYHLQLPPWMRAADRPRQPDVRHHLHPAQRAREDWLRRARRHPQPRQDLPREHEEYAPYRPRIRM